MQVPVTSSSPRPVKEWSILCYNAGQADAGKMGTAALLDLERVGSDEDTHVVVFNHRSGWWPEKLLNRVGLFRGPNGTRVYEVQPAPSEPPGEPLLMRLARPFPREFHRFSSFVASSPAQIRSQEVQTLPEGTNAGDAATLKAFLLDAMQKYPARHYAVVLTGHGAAFAGQLITHAPEGRVMNEELARVLQEVQQQSGRKIDLLNLNTCYGANLESLFPLRKAVDTVVASEAATFAGAQPLGQVLGSLQQAIAQGSSPDGQGLARLCVEEARYQPLANSYTRSLSALDMRALDPLVEAVQQFQDTLMQEKVPSGELRERLRDSKRVLFNRRDRQVFLVDLRSFAQGLTGHANPAVRARAKQVIAALERCVLAEQHTDPSRESFMDTCISRVMGQHDLGGAGGLTVYYDDDVSGPGNRLAEIRAGDYGKQHDPAPFLHYLGQAARQERESRTLPSIGQFYQKACIAATEAAGVPELAPVVRFFALPFTLAGTLAGLRAAGVPVGAIMGGVAVVMGGRQILRGLREVNQAAAQPGEWGPMRRRQAVNGASRLLLAAGQITLGCMGLGLAPHSVLAPGIAMLGLSGEGPRFLELLLNRSERRGFRQEAERFAARPAGLRVGLGPVSSALVS